MKKRDNRGMSLIELLIAVTILGIIITPILHSFVTSYRINAKNRKILRATTLAQNEMEIFEKEKIEDLQDTTKFDYEMKKDPATGRYEFAKKDVRNDSADNQLFDVYVSLKPDGEHKLLNEKGVATLDNMGTSGSGRFVQPIRTKYSSQAMDEAMYKEFLNSAYRAGHFTMNEEYFENNLERTITLKIEKVSGITKAKVIYKYECKDTSVVEAGKAVVTKEYPIFDNTNRKDESGHLIELQSLYLFYAPRYNNNKDVIQVINKGQVEANVNIVRMDILAEGKSSEVESVPSTYKPTIEIDDLGLKGRYFTNLNIDNDVSGLMKGAQATVKKGVDASATKCKADDVNLKVIGSKDKKNRVYDMTVEVYRNGQRKGIDDPIVTLTGTKLE